MEEKDQIQPNHLGTILYHMIAPGIDGEVIGIGKQGNATSRSLPITEYEDINSIWNNTLSNGITVPNFRLYSTYNKRNQKITTHFESNGAYKSGEPLAIGEVKIGLVKKCR